MSNRPLKILCPGCQVKLDVSGLPAFSEIPCPRCAATVVVPRWFQNFLLEEILSSRGAVTVYRALDPTLDREVCIRFLHNVAPAHGTASRIQAYAPELALPFQENVRRTAALLHQHIAPVYTCGEQDGSSFAVRQYIQGFPGQVALEGRRPDWPAVLQYTQAAVEALQFAGERGISHGHIVPDNLMLDADGVLRLCDFGVAASLGMEQENPAYLAPEYAGRPVPGTASDIFSLGVCLYEFCTGQLPCGGDRIGWLRGTQVLASPRTLNSALPPRYAELLQQMLALQPEQRPGNFGIILAALRRIAADAEPAERKPTRKSLLISNRRPGHQQVRLVRVQRSSGAGFVNLLILLLLAVLAVLAVMLWHKHDKRLRETAATARQTPAPGRQTVTVTLGDKPEKEPERGPSPVAAAESVAATGPELLTAAMLQLRPRPADYDFKGQKEQIQAYLAAVPDALRETEKNRIRWMASYKEYLLAKIQKIPYSSEEGPGLLLKSGQRLAGTITFFSDEQVLKVRPANLDGADLQEIPWEALHQQQLWEIAEYYIKRSRAEISDPKGVSPRKVRDVFEEYRYLIVFADWYEDQATCRRLCAEALTLPLADARRQLAEFITLPTEAP